MREIAQLAEQCTDVYMFTDNPTVIGRIPNPTPHIEAWLSNLFNLGQRSRKVLVIDGSHEHAPSVKPQQMLELIGWLPQLHAHLVCVCSSGGKLPEWTELASLITDHNKLVLRSMSSQLSNKLARHCVDGISSPYAARHTTLQRIKDHKKQNARLGPLLSKYPDLADGVEALNKLGIPIAHPERLRVAEGSPQAVMHEVLTTLINIHFDKSDMLEPVRQVMQCLEHLSSELGEPLFIDTHTKP
eukprot:gene25247-10895_t